MRLAYMSASVFTILCTAAFAAAPMATLLPDTTQGCVLAPDVQLLQEKFDQTEFGKWVDDPLMKPFLDDLRAQVRDEGNPDKISYGLTWDDVKDVARGEAALALAHTPKTRPARVVLVDVKGNVPAATAILTKIFNSLSQQRATWKQEKLHGEKITIYTLPKNPKDPHRPAKTAYFIMRDVLAAVEDEGVAKAIMGRIAGQRSGTLESIAGFQAVMRRCQADAEKTGAGEPHVRWYMNPLPYAEARRQLDPQFLKDGKVDLLRALRNSGFQGVKAVGGYAHLAAKPYDVLNRAAIYAPPPYARTLAGIKTPNAAPIAPPAWIPAPVASFSAASIDLPTLLDEKHAGPLYDFTLGDGDGAWKDTLKGIREDKRGPQVDLEERLFAKMGLRALRITDVKETNKVPTERWLMIAELADAKVALAAMETFYANDKTAKKQAVDGQSYWEIWPEQPKPEDIPSGVAIVHGHFLYATQADMLKGYFKDLSQEKQLAQDADYRKVLEHIQAEAGKRGWDTLCLQRFVRSQEAYKPTYELTRSNKLPTSETMLSNLLNMMVGQEPGGKPRQQRTDGGKLPAYSEVQHYLLPSGSLGVREDAKDFQGWFFLGFSLAKTNGGVAAKPE